MGKKIKKKRGIAKKNISSIIEHKIPVHYTQPKASSPMINKLVIYYTPKVHTAIKSHTMVSGNRTLPKKKCDHYFQHESPFQKRVVENG